MKSTQAFRVRSLPLQGGPLVENWLAGDPTALSFFPGAPRNLAGYLAKAEEVDQRFGGDAHTRAAAHLSGGGVRSAERLRAFVEQRGFMVTTGQQPGIFGGPLYGLYKGLTAATLAERLEAELGRPVLPVFWIASEDHMWNEVRGIHVLDPGNELQEVALASRDSSAPLPLHRIRLGAEIQEARTRFLGLHPETDFSGKWREILERAYTPDATLADGFHDVMETLLGPAGVFLIQAHEPRLKERALPLLMRELRESRERDEALVSMGSALQEAGFELQVPLLEGATNLFFEGESGRERIFLDDGGFRMRGSGVRMSLQEIEARVTDDPSLLSPNVLLRPMVESALLPTLSYVAGPGEAAYLPQTTPVFRGHGIGRPIVHPRLALFLIETKVEKVLEKFQIGLEEMALPHHELVSRLVRDEIPDSVRDPMDGLREAIASRSADLMSEVAAMDPTLAKVVDSLRNQGLGLVEELEKKLVQSLKRENEITLSQVAKAQVHLFPLGRPQERILNPFYYLMRYDETILEQVRDEARNATLP